MHTSQRIGLFFALAGVAVGCSGGYSGDETSCPNVAGVFALVAGDCPVSSCIVEQDECDVRVNCGEFEAVGTIGSVKNGSAPLELDAGDGPCSADVTSRSDGSLVVRGDRALADRFVTLFPMPAKADAPTPPQS